MTTQWPWFAKECGAPSPQGIQRSCVPPDMMPKTILRPWSAALPLVVAFVGLLPGAEPATAFQDPEGVFRFTQITDGVYASVTRDGVNPSAYANAVVFVGTDAALVVDAQHSPDAAATLVREIREVTDRPVRWVVNTHWHGDHVWGNAGLDSALRGPAFIGHPATRDSLIQGGQDHLLAEARRLEGIIQRIVAAQEADEIPTGQEQAYAEALDRYRGQLEGLGRVQIRPPTVLVESEMRFDLGGRTIHVIHAGPAHTQGDVVVWDPGTGVLAAGDLLEEAPLWLEGADVRGWAEALATLRRLDPRIVLPSHGRVREDANLLRAHAGFLEDAVRLFEVGMPSDSAAQIQTLSQHRGPLGEFGIDGPAFEAYVAAVQAALAG